MSIYFVRGDGTDVWNPGSGTARVFHGQVELAAQLMHRASGLGPIESDEIVIDVESFASFAEAFAAWILQHQEHSPVVAMLGTCLAMVLELVQLLGGPSPDDPRLARFVGRGLVRTG